MKHALKVTLLLVLIFVLSQLVGLAILNEYIDVKQSSETGTTVVNEAVYNVTGAVPPKVENESITWIFIVISILIGTGLVLLLIRFKEKTRWIWKLWFFFAVFYCLRYAFAPFIDKFVRLFSATAFAYSFWAAIIIAFVFAFYKIFKPNIYMHNFTEIFIYGGIAALIVPIINMFSVFVILGIISLYDMYAVWKSKHMVAMAQYQAESQMFAGLMLPYHTENGKVSLSFSGKKKEGEYGTGKTETVKAGTAAVKMPLAEKKVSGKHILSKNRNNSGKLAAGVESETKTAILGGGDVAFPLLFAGVVFKTTGSIVNPLIVVSATTIALFLLLYYAKKDTFYPAMPFISAGCIAGYLITLLL